MGFGFRILFLEGELGRGEDCISRVASQDPPALAITQDLPLTKPHWPFKSGTAKKRDDTEPPTPKKDPGGFSRVFLLFGCEEEYTAAGFISRS